MEWNELSKATLEAMEVIGNYGPTANPEGRTVKGYTWDADDGCGGQCYLDSRDLREIAVACIEVADWLDKRAEESI
jgi:hypothetical protein